MSSTTFNKPVSEEIYDIRNTVVSVSEETGNIFGVSVSEYEHNGITVINNHDGTYTIDGTATGSTFIRNINADIIPNSTYHSYFVLEPGTYTIKKGFIDNDGNFIKGTSNYVRFMLYDDYTASSVSANTDIEYTFTVTTTQYGRFRIATSGTVYNHQTIAIYVSKGDHPIELPHMTGLDSVARTMASGKYATEFHTKEDEVVRKVLANRRPDTLTVALIADTHQRSVSYGTMNDTKKQAYAIAKMAEKVDASVIIHLGDVIQGHEDTHVLNENSMVELWSYLNRTYIPVLYTIGNHEMNGHNGTSQYMVDPTGLSMEDCMGLCGFSDKQLFPIYSSDRTNWYVDIKGVRLIGLNSTSVSSTRGFRDADKTFLSDALTNVSLPVVVFSHVAPIMKNKTVDQGADIINILNTFVDGGGTLIAYIHGHNHLDSYVAPNTNLDGTTIKFKLIGIACAYVRHYDDDILPDWYGDPVSPNRTIGTYSEYLFDLVNIHKTDGGTVNLYRFGAGGDRTH